MPEVEGFDRRHPLFPILGRRHEARGGGGAAPGSEPGAGAPSGTALPGRAAQRPLHAVVANSTTPAEISTIAAILAGPRDSPNTAQPTRAMTT